MALVAARGSKVNFNFGAGGPPIYFTETGPPFYSRPLKPIPLRVRKIHLVSAPHWMGRRGGGAGGKKTRMNLSKTSSPAPSTATLCQPSEALAKAPHQSRGPSTDIGLGEAIALSRPASHLPPAARSHSGAPLIGQPLLTQAPQLRPAAGHSLRSV